MNVIEYPLQIFRKLYKQILWVAIVTCYGMNGPEIESRCGRNFPHHFRMALGPTLSPIQWLNGYRVILGGKAAGAWR